MRNVLRNELFNHRQHSFLYVTPACRESFSKNDVKITPGIGHYYYWHQEFSDRAWERKMLKLLHLLHEPFVVPRHFFHTVAAKLFKQPVCYDKSSHCLPDN